MSTHNVDKAGYKIVSADDVADIYVYGGIDMPDHTGAMVFADDLVREIKGLAAEHIRVHLATVGGDPVSAGGIYQALVTHGAKVTTIVDSKAYSAGSMILQAGDERVAGRLSMVMVHGPSMRVAGKAGDLRKAADVLDQHMEMMVGAYTRKGIDEATVRGWLSSEEDHYFTAAEARAAGLVDRIDDMAVAAAAPREYQIAAMAAQERAEMSEQDKGSVAPETIVREYDAAQKTGLTQGAKAEAKRQSEIRSLYRMRSFQAPQVRAVLDACLDDIRCDKATALERALSAAETLPEAMPIDVTAHGDDGGYPWAGTTSPGTSAQAPRFAGGLKRQSEGLAKALEIRSGLVRDRSVISAERRGNEYLGMSLTDIMAMELRDAGIRAGGDRTHIARQFLAHDLAVRASGPSHGTDHFTGILADVANKSALMGWDGAQETWAQWTISGTLNDYRTAKRTNLALLDKLTRMKEHQEWEYGDATDYSQGITGHFHGLKYGFSVQALVNDDLGQLNAAMSAWGEAASATVGDYVYAALFAAGTGGYGQDMDEDSKAVFHADHSNYVASGSGAPPSITTLDTARTAMRTQTDPNARTIGVIPRYLIHGPAEYGTVWSLLNSTTLIEGATSVVRPDQNWVSRAGLTPIEEYRIADFAGTLAWVLASDRRTVEVAGVGGPVVPQVFRSMVSNIPGITFEVSVPFGVAALDYRSMYLNYGA